MPEMSGEARAALAALDRLHRKLMGRRREVVELEDYYRGKHPLAYASHAWSKHHADRYKRFSDNWCGVVGTSPAERITVQGFRLDAADALSGVERDLWLDWRINEMDAQSSQGFLASIVARRSYVLVWGSPDDEPVVTWERADQVATETGPDRRTVTAAVKVWRDGDQEHATLYLPDAIWKWRRAALDGVGVVLPPGVELPAGGWSPRQESADASWPIANPLGVVPVVEVLNRPLLGGEPLSDIEGARCMQDAINLLWAYLFAAADHASLPARVVMGQEPPSLPILDENGVRIGQKPVDMDDLAQRRLLWLNGTDTTIGQWEPAKLDVFTAVVNVAVRHLAAQTRTPVHYIVGELTNVNGETLLAGEAGLVKKVEEFQLYAGPAIRRVMALMALVRGQREVAAACRAGVVQWRSPETRTTAQLADAALKDRQIGLPLAWIAEHRLDLSPDEVERLMAMVEAEAADPLLKAATDPAPAAAPGGPA